MKKFVQASKILCILFVSLFLNYSADAQAGITWTSRASAADNNWFSVTYGKGLFVAVAGSGTGNRVMTSPDGIAWTSRVSAADNSWFSVTHGNGLFVAVAVTGTGNRVMTSPDGINWTSRNSAADNFWTSVTYGNGLFVAVAGSGTGNRVMTSPDGINWTSRVSAADNEWRSVTYGNGLFVAVAGSGAGNRVMTSPDGINWTIRTTPVNAFWWSVTYGNGLFVAVKFGSGPFMTSPNGIDWTIRTPASNSDWRSVTYGNGLFVAVSNNSGTQQVMTSPNGINWTLRNSAVGNAWLAVTYANGLFVAVASSGTNNRVMTSGIFTPLPLKWVSVTGSLNTQKQAVLHWRVDEDNVDRYEIEKSDNGVHFLLTGIIKSKGNGTNNYSHTAITVLTGTGYYRIKQVDINGSFTFSTIIRLSASKQSPATLFPNPAKELITVTVGNGLLYTDAQLMDMNGRLIHQFRISNTSFTITTAELSSGIYMIKWADGEVSRIVKE
jgi:hypothetical protein